MEKVSISSPWVSFYREIDALFKEDPEVRIIYDEEENVVKLYVSNARKAEALTQLLPAERTFGKVTVRVDVIPANDLGTDMLSLFEAAFDGNPALAYVRTGGSPITSAFNYVVFKNKVVQYFNDDLGDVYGNRSTLYQELAKDVFSGQTDGVFFCTEIGDKLGEPFDSWA